MLWQLGAGPLCQQPFHGRWPHTQDLGQRTGAECSCEGPVRTRLGRMWAAFGGATERDLRPLPEGTKSGATGGWLGNCRLCSSPREGTLQPAWALPRH